MSRFFAIFTILLSFCVADFKLRFRQTGISSGSNRPYPKNQPGKFDHDEDAWSMTPFSLGVSDGVSSCVYTSKHWASLFAYKFQHFVHDKIIGKDYNYEDASLDVEGEGYQDTLSKTAFEYLKGLRITYNAILDTQRKSFVQKTERQPDNFDDSNLVSATLIGAWIDPALEDTLHILQMGDSLLGVFKVQLNEDEKSGIYYPSFITPDHRRGFNFPHQFRNDADMNGDKTKEKDEILHRTTYVSEHSIVIAGSDGLWDNVHTSVITIMLNLAVHFHDIFEGNKENIAEEIDVFTTSLSELMIDWYEVMKVDTVSQGFLTQELLSKKTKDPEWKPKEKKGFNIMAFLCLAVEDNETPVKISHKDLLSRKLNEVLKKLQKNSISPKAYKLEAELLHAIVAEGVHELIKQPWNSGRTTYYTSQDIKGALQVALAADVTMIQRFQKDFDTNSVSSLLASVAKYQSNLGPKYASPFYMAEVEDAFDPESYRVKRFNINPQKIEARGKADDITVIATIVDQGSPDDLASFEFAISKIETEEKKVEETFFKEQFAFAKWADRRGSLARRRKII